MFQSILGNTFIATTGRIINTLLGVIAIGIISRLLGVSLYGVYVLLFSYGALLQIAADFGLYLTLSRTLSSHPQDHMVWIGHTVGLRLFLLIVSFTLGIVAVIFFIPLQSHIPALIIVALGLSFQSLSQLMMSVFQYHSSIWRATVSDLVGRLIQIAGLLMVVYVQPSFVLEWAVAWFTISSLVTYLLNWKLLPIPRSMLPKFSWERWKNITKEAWPFALLLVLNVIYFRIDVVMLSVMRDPEEVGWYGLAYRMIESGLFFPAMVGGLLLPRLIAAFKDSATPIIQALLRHTTHLMLLVAGLIAVVVPNEATSIVTFISGASFAPAGPLLVVLSGALIIMLFGNIAGFGLVAFNRQRFLVGLYGALVAVNILGNLFLIPLYGALGAAWMTVLTELLSTCIATAVIWRSYMYAPDTWFLCRVVLITGALALLWKVLPGQWHVVVRIISGCVLYVLFAYLVQLFNPVNFKTLITKNSA